MRTVCIIQARLGSSRLPAKVLLPLPTGRVVLQEVIHRCKQIDGVDEVAVACPSEDVDILSSYIPSGVDCISVSGDPNNVLHRYYVAAQIMGADHIVRITADCPMLDPLVSSNVVQLHKLAGCHYTSNVYPVRHYPPGYDTEVFSIGALLEAMSLSDLTPYDLEHVTPAIRTIAEKSKALGVYNNGTIDLYEYCTLDTIADYRYIWGIMDNDTAPC